MSEKTGLKPTKKDRKKFDLDLAYGQLHEDRIADMLQNKKIEVKTERDQWSKTGNICIEFQSWGKAQWYQSNRSRLLVSQSCFG